MNDVIHLVNWIISPISSLNKSIIGSNFKMKYAPANDSSVVPSSSSIFLIKKKEKKKKWETSGDVEGILWVTIYHLT